jgi:hypothetical protein
MSRAQSANLTVGPTAVGLLIAVTLIAGCGVSTPAANVHAPQSTGATAPVVSSPAARRSPPSAAQPQPAVGSPTVVAPNGHPPRRIPPAHPVPAAFRPAPGAPSDAEVQRELAQMAAIQRQEHQQALSAAAANLAGLLPWSLEPKSGTQVSVASVFTDYGLGLACGGVLGREQLGVAHKTAPCGTLITFTYAGRSLTVPVIDRGPYIAGREWDLTGATAAALGFPGLGQIQWSVAG